MIFTQLATAQGVSDPLGIYGLDNFSAAGARSRAMGWTATAIGSDATSLFGNPARLARLEQYEVRIGGLAQRTKYSQRQEWYPDKVYATLSLMFENRLRGIIDTGQVKLQRGFDTIGPNWESEKTSTRPSLVAGAFPVEIAGMKMTLALGYSEIVNLNHYYQNNNALEPYVGSFNPEPYPRPSLGDTIRVRWYQYVRERTGEIYGVTPAVGVTLNENFDVGIAATILTGVTDDRERRQDRGLIRLTTSSTGNFNVHFVDSVHYEQSMTGTSTFSGVLTTIGLSYRSRDYSFGVTIRPGTTITQKVGGTVRIDTTGSSVVQTKSQTDKLELPLTYALGGSFGISERLRIAIDYVINKYGAATYVEGNGITSHPWLDGTMFRIGVEFQALDALVLRGGFREDTQVYAGEGAPIVSDPFRGYGLTAGFGLSVGLFSFDAAYEYSALKYEDRWLSNVNYNQRTGNSFVLETRVQF